MATTNLSHGVAHGRVIDRADANHLSWKFLKVYIALRDFIDRRVFYYWIKLTGQTHPKNIFGARVGTLLSDVKVNQNVADLGCGSGKLCFELIQYGVQKVIGLDFLPPKNQKGVTFFKTDITSSEAMSILRTQNVDCVVLSHTLEHIVDPIKLLKDIFKSGVKEILICVPSKEGWIFRTKSFLGLDPLTDPTHVKEYDFETLIQEVQNAGGKVIKIFYNAEGEIQALAQVSQSEV